MEGGKHRTNAVTFSAFRTTPRHPYCLLYHLMFPRYVVQRDGCHLVQQFGSRDTILTQLAIQLPTMKTILETYDQLSAKEQAAVDRRVKSHELILVMRRSYNFDTDSLQHPFLDAFKQYDLAEAKGKSSSELSDLRFGCWIFLYVVIQALPMLAVDAPGVRFTEGAEYFLCMPPKGDPPWMEDGASVRKVSQY